MPTVSRFQELYEFQSKNQKESPWCQNETIVERAEELIGEVRELMEELQKKPHQRKHLLDETGDVLWNTLALIAKAEHQGILTINEVLEYTLQKYQRRKPFLLTGEHITREEEQKLWQKIKAEEHEHETA